MNGIRRNLICEIRNFGDNNGYDFVDLGLSVAWATCNVGATKEENCGLYFAWGETKGYRWATDKSGGFNWASTKYCQGSTHHGPWEKYTTDISLSHADNKAVLELEDDAAHAYMGGDWRMPSTQEIRELIDSVDLSITSYLNEGIKFTSKTDSSKILYVPFCGQIDGNYDDDGGTWFGVLSNSINTLNNKQAPCMYGQLNNNGANVFVGDGSDRFKGRSVRGVLSKEGNANGYEYVDMGTSVLWATCNVGAESPLDKGLYFSWGETKGYKTASEKGGFTWDTYKYNLKEESDIFSKYYFLQSVGKADNKTVLDLEDDAAHINMGGDWRMPTKEKFQELVDNCDTEWTEINGLYGLRFISKINHKSIFIPAWNTCLGTSTPPSPTFETSNKCCRYWSSSLDTENMYVAYTLDVDNDGKEINPCSNYYSNYGRCAGRSIRGVLPLKEN